jgi:hypothetical protein
VFARQGLLTQNKRLFLQLSQRAWYTYVQSGQWSVVSGKGRGERNDEGRRSKGKAVRISDFGLLSSFELRASAFSFRASFVIRASAFGLRIGSRASSIYFPAPQKTTGKKSAKKTMFSSRKTAFGFRRFAKTAKTSRKQLG